MNCTQIDQGRADSLLKELSEQSFNQAFHVEKERKERKEPIWALPSGERIYYTVSIEGTDVLLAGINSKHLNLSSFAKLAEEEQFNGQGRRCVKKLIETVLVPLCKNNNKKNFDVLFTSDEGRKVLCYLEKNVPAGIARITRSTSCRFHIE